MIDGSVFTRFPLPIARMDQLSRSDELKNQLDRCDWDLVVVDQAHRMSGHYFGAELHTIKRHQLGQLLGRHAGTYRPTPTRPDRPPAEGMPTRRPRVS